MSRNNKADKKSLHTENTDEINKKGKGISFIKPLALLVFLIFITFVIFGRINGSADKSNAKEVIHTVKVENRDIQYILSSSGIIEPLNTYDVTSQVVGDVISADFAEGEQVKKDEVLYQITTDDIDSKLRNAENAVPRAKEDYKFAKDKYAEAVQKYNDALDDYDDAADDYGDLTIKSKKAGVVKTLFVDEGDKIQIGTQIAEIYDNSYMELKVPFNSADVKQSLIGKTAKVEITDSNEKLEGNVTEISSIEDVLSGNRVVKTITIKVKNPGGLTAGTKATASIGDLYSSGEGIFNVLEEGIITADKAGEIHTLNIKEGDKISEKYPVIVLDSDTYKDQLDAYQNKVDNAKDIMDNAENTLEKAHEKIDDAKTSLEDVIEDKTDYSVTSPISGVVASKDVLEGDTIRNTTPKLCTIYDLSAVKFDMPVDELDIKAVKIGQKVNVTSNALEGRTFHGIVTNISQESTYTNGVPEYPVTVQIDDFGDLYTGMNVTGEIIINEVQDVMAVPNGALIRGGVVYVKDPAVKEVVNHVPVGFKEVKVKTGLTDGKYTEILDGLTGEEELFVLGNVTELQTGALNQDKNEQNEQMSNESQDDGTTATP
ncbi:efflux RND transporter periplasmic adaptor subunit [Anaerocolumna sp. MB42-C2]|uniref:efflux RND transporter periplasmic adaptor subunit n=1 Tax=Anaerocolumna sp. MB42-C2 TaxID=3070997 RepID=UPI0027E15FB9|nr:efflux RND transporter periplasmic adaptor subunit [Anaerocolumna sp. MB42-C2]WMJ88197.1 efflux RND transporter periplasmic adaptor subunit [Anaerocolumna sp. MB42-C2]